MGRGYILGLLFGAIVAGVSLAGVSLVIPFASPMPELGVQQKTADGSEPQATDEADKTERAIAALDAALAPVAEPSAEPKPEAEPELPVASTETPSAEPAGEEPAGAEAEPQPPVVAEPGMDTALTQPETDSQPVAPEEDTVPSAVQMPEVDAPEATSDPVTADATPAVRPEAPDAPAALIVPGSVAESGVLPDGEAAIAAGPDEASLPRLADIAAPDTTVPGVVTEPAPAPVAEAPATLADEVAPTEAPEPEADEAAGDAVDTAEGGENDGMTPGEAASMVPMPSVSRLPQIVPEPEEVATLPESGPDEGVTPAALEPRIVALAPAPQPGFAKRVVPGVKINRLPTIGGTGGETRVLVPESRTVVVEPAPAPAAEAVPDVVRYAAPFDNPEAKPLVAVVLIDDDSIVARLDADALAAIGMPVTIAIDPDAPDAAARATTYRLAGNEVAIYLPTLPAGANASDLEVIYQGVTGILPESVAVIGAPDISYQTDRRVAQHLVALLETEGRGLITYGKGLNPAHQAASGAGLPEAVVYRALDNDGENAAAISRYLDRAAFEAARAGWVLVVGHNSPDTVMALRDWVAAGAKGAIVGPASAVMKP